MHAHARRRRPLPRVLALLTALLTGLALAALPAAAREGEPQPADATLGGEPAGEVTPARVDGRNRFETAANIARLTFDTADVAVVATGQDYPDALAGSFAAGSVGGPLLLTTRDGIPEATWDALADLEVGTVILLGGSAAISEAVEAELAGQGYTVERAFGTNRYETAAQVAVRYGTVPDGGLGTLDGDTTAILASGQNFPDALSSGPLAAGETMPLLLTPTDAPHGAVDRTLEELDIERIVVVGGTASVSSAVVQHYADLGYEVERWAGRNRTETAVVVAQNLIERFEDYSAQGILLARGDDYPDALTASIHGGTIGAPLVLTATPRVLSPATEGWLFDTCPAISFVRAIGGVGAVTEQALREAVNAAERCRVDDDPGFSFCGNVQDGYTVSYPDHWVTNIRSIGDVPACSLFDPDPDSLRTEGQEVPLDIGAFLRVEAVDFEEASTADPRFETEISRTEEEVDDRPAVRLETEATGDGHLPAGTSSTRWVVDLGGGQTFIAVYHDVGEPTYVEKQDVLDIMMDAIVFDHP